MNLKSIEQAVLLFVANELETEKAAIEAFTGPIVLNVVNGAVKIADGVFAKLPLGIGAVLDAALAGYVKQYEPDLSQYEGQGIDALSALLKKIAAGL
ncbi:MAG TPA: hypothetical protein VHX17_10660 [Candidatus Cybelea sp.]|jgi:hypothetical protein|nr:hypothetical protein [Candidatus Cybelea sp.]